MVFVARVSSQCLAAHVGCKQSILKGAVQMVVYIVICPCVEVLYTVLAETHFPLKCVCTHSHHYVVDKVVLLGNMFDVSSVIWIVAY